ncbi:Eco57I restriction-modification methylase domain-containing protein [Melittangium boletus]|uniref:site-specific DNA-methyltransferase (adenine-specific) n=1 Tax=Melittangium boletus DSM 14713 TaxID=1294270 RepID=A0A250IGB4_9BACT|nr:N-6 DNA methylase [Melittangium boletus]ATB30298.1 modification methylase [Melittangium boletus DSM 14713]
MNFIENETRDKLRGGYYTDPAIAAYLVRWVLEVRPRAVLEPSCGDGAFFRALKQTPEPTGLERLVACELDGEEAAKACQEAQALPGVRAEVHHADFLDWALGRMHEPPEFDAVVGNPPFIRYQYLSDTAQGLAARVITHFGLRFTRHTNAWVPFVIAALSRLKPGGRLAMVVPAELLHVLHADSARRYLLRTCSRILVLDPEELWFENTQQGVVLLMAEKRRADAPEGTLGAVAITRIRGRECLASTPARHVEGAEYVPGEELPGKWMLALLTARERAILGGLRGHEAVRPFSRIARVAVGIVTGANKFFLVPDSVVEEYGLGAYAWPMFGRSAHVEGIIYDARAHAENKRQGLPTNFLWFKDAPRDALPERVRAYIERGEAMRLHERFKCRIREPWYTVPSVFTAPVGMLKRCHDYPRLIHNAHGAYTTDTAYRIFPREPSAPRLVHAFVNSLTALCAELEGRHYGGGVLELVPSEINRLLVPLPPEGGEDLGDLDALCRANLPAEEVLAQRDSVLLGGIGLSPGEWGELQRAWGRLRHRRQRTGGGDEAEPGEE